MPPRPIAWAVKRTSRTGKGLPYDPAISELHLLVDGVYTQRFIKYGATFYPDGYRIEGTVGSAANLPLYLALIAALGPKAAGQLARIGDGPIGCPFKPHDQDLLDA